MSSSSMGKVRRAAMGHGQKFETEGRILRGLRGRHRKRR